MPLTPEEQREFRRLAAEQRAARATAGDVDVPAEEVQSPRIVPVEGDQVDADTGAGFGDLVPGFIANPFRRVTTQGARDVAGGLVQNIISGERFVNTIGGFVGEEELGTRVSERLRDVPVAGRVLEAGFDVAAAPLTALTAGFGPAAGGLIKGGSAAARVGRGFVAPLTEGGLTSRVAAEVALGVGTQVGSEVLAESGVPAPLAMLGGVGAGIIGAGTIAGATARQTRRAARRSPKGVAELLASEDVIERTEGAFRSVKRLTKAEIADIARQRTAQLASRAGARRGVIERGGGTPEIFTTSAGKLRGELPKVQFEPLAERLPTGGARGLRMPDADIQELHDILMRHPQFKNPRTNFMMTDTEEGLMNALLGEMPTTSELTKLRRVFGEDFVDSILDLRSVSAKNREMALDFMGIPRAVMSSMDLSAPFRQGALLMTHKEFWLSLGPMVRAFASDIMAGRTMDSILERPGFSVADEAGLDFVETEALQVAKRQEQFPSALAAIVPLVKRSERAFVTFLNKLRADMFDNTVARWERSGRAATKEELESLANWYNIATGRGIKDPTDLTAVAGTIIFSPQNLMSRVKTISGQAFFTSTERARKEVARDMWGFVAAGISALTLMKVLGDQFDFPVQIELDPRSADFGKGKVGKTRFDPWAGFQPIARYVAQASSMQRKTLAGDVRKADPRDTGFRFATSKLAPVPGALVDLLRGETFLGEAAPVGAASTYSEMAASRLVPMFTQDIFDAAREEGMLGAFKALPGGFGVGIGTYESLGEERNRLAAKLTNDEFTWDELSNLQKQQLEEENAEELERAAGEPRSDSFTSRATEVDEKTRDAEAQIMEALLMGAEPRLVNDALSDVMRERSIELRAFAKAAGFADEESDAVDAYYEALRQADLAPGITDFAARDQLAATLLAELSEQDQKRVEESQVFQHDPSASEFLASRDVIRDSPYWKQQEAAFAWYKKQVGRVSSTATTYFQLQNEQRVAGGRQAARIQTVLAAIDRRTRLLRERLRRKSPALDAALVMVYGLTPIRGR